MEREKLAINLYKDEIINKIIENKVVVIEAPTGSGKTTQIPQIIFNAGLDKWGLIGVTQPRRIATFGVSKRIAKEMNVELGALVGYKMRFDDMTSPNTKIKIMTDGILLEELRSDPLLLKYSIIIVDEAHERSLNIDFILGLLKNILEKREDFKVIVSSATINAKLFSDYFWFAPIISIKTETFPVEERYFKMKNIEDQAEQFALIGSIINKIEQQRNQGDVLIFLPGEGAIKECCTMIENIGMQFGNTLEVLPLYARLSPDEQNRVFDEYPGKRKIIVATNIAETSVTIDGIVHVIDPGYAKINYYNPRTFTSYLELKPTSKASSDQRKGRAGRTAPGVVYRLYSKEEYGKKEAYTKEEIYRTDLSEVVLRMADLGIDNYTEFDFISPPTKGTINSAIDTLISLDALDSHKRLTDMGKMMVDFPLMPRLSRILLESLVQYPEVLLNVLIVISYLSAKRPFLYPRGEELESQTAQKKLYVKGGDFFSWINIFYKYEKTPDKEKFCKMYYLDPMVMGEIVNINYQLTSMLKQRGYQIKQKYDYNKILLCICAGLKQYICHLGHKKKNSYISLTEQDIRIHPGSYLFYEHPDWLVGGEIVNTGRTYVRSGASIPEKLVKTKLADVYLNITHPKKKTPTKEETYISVATTKTTPKEPERIIVGDKYFDVVKERGESLVNVPYNIIIQLKDQKELFEGLHLDKKKAKLTYKDVVITRDRFASLIHYFDKIDLDNGYNNRYPAGQSLLYPDDWVTLYSYIPNIMRPTVKKNNRSHAGFLTLRYAGDEAYEYYLEHDFYTALETSIEALSSMFDASYPAWTDQEKLLLDKKYRKLTEILEELES